MTTPQPTDENPSTDNQYGLSDEQAHLLLEAIDAHDKQSALSILSSLHAADIANFIDMIRHDQREIIISFLYDSFDAGILVELDPDVQKDVIDILGLKKSGQIISSLESDDAIDILENLNEEIQKEILAAMPHNSREELEEGLAFPEDSAGRLLEKDIVTIPEYWNVGQVIDFLRRKVDISKDFYQMFVVDPKLQPVGAIVPSRLICSKRDVSVKEIMTPSPITVNAEMDQEEVAYLFRQYALVSAPVVSNEGRMIGVINVNDIVHVIDEEAHEDIMRLGGISETDIHSSLFDTVKRRFPWLLVNLVTAILASIVIAMFEGNIEKLAALAVLMPIVASMGGNAGTQTLTVAVRAIATRELSDTNAWRIVFKETFASSLNGLLFAIITAILIFYWYQNPILSITFAIAVIVTLCVAGLTGTLIPIGLVRAGVDPAIASGVFLTTVTDICAFGIFLGLAQILV